tara:strand:+ start:848 stop:1063 length:216 start_codon:yes stop_codon:yes gene_type:complete
MIPNKCLYCGSPNLKADRALSGRLVCTTCGNLYGVRRVGRKQVNNFSYLSIKKKYWLFIFIFIISFLLIVI